MKIATWNVKNFYDVGEYPEYNGRTLFISEAYTSERILYFSDEIRRSDPDILFLQEVLAEGALMTLAEELGYHAFKANKDHRGIANTVLYKKNLEGILCESVSTVPMPLPSLSEKESDQTAIYVRREFAKVLFSYKGKTVTLFGVHLKSGLPLFLEGEDRIDESLYSDALARSVMQKMGEILQLRALIREEIKKGNEVVVTGDFNESTSSILFSILKASPVGSAELADAMTGALSPLTTHIHHGEKKTFDTMLGTPFLARNIKKVEIFNENLHDMSELPLDNREIESDHAMVVVDFNF